MQQESSISPSHEPTNQPTHSPRREGVKSVFSTLAILIAAPAIAVLLTMFVFQSYQVDGPSMETTLQNNDRLIVWKLPRTVARITGHAYVPHRGDIVIFVEQGLRDFSSGGSKQLIKRVVGLPGDRVVINNGSITIFNKDNPSGFNPDKNHDFSSGIASFTSGDVDFVVPTNQVYVCGDNRPNSLDSRSFSSVPVSAIVGKLSLRIFPIAKFRSFI